MKLISFLVPRSWRETVLRDLEDEARERGKGRWWMLGQLLRVGARLQPVINGSTMMFELRYATRQLVRHRWFSLGAIATFGLGIGVNLAVFAITDSVLFRSLPFREPDRLVSIYATNSTTGQVFFQFPAQLAVEIARSGGAVGEVGFAGRSRAFRDQKDGTVLRLVDTSFNSLSMLGVQPIAGRIFQRSDAVARLRMAMLREDVWRGRYAADPKVIGKQVQHSDGPIQIVGVLPKGFIVPSVNWATPSDGLILSSELLETTDGKPRAVPGLVGRLQPGATVQDAQRDVDAAASRANVAGQKPYLRVQALQEGLFWNYRAPLSLLFIGGGVVWLIACLNLAVLVTARSEAAVADGAIQVALGASTARVAGGLVMQVIILCLAGAGVAVIGFRATIATIVSLSPDSLRALIVTGPDLRLLGAILAMSVAGAVLASLYPALRLRRANLRALVQTQAMAAPGGARLFRTLILTEAALGTLLALAGSLSVQSYLSLSQSDLGFQPQPVQVVGVLPSTAVPPEDFLRILRAVPGVAHAGVVDSPHGSGEAPTTLRLPSGIEIVKRAVGGGYVEAMAIEVVAGQAWNDSPQENSSLLNASAARTLWPTASSLEVIGRVVDLPGDRPRVVVGVIRDTRERHGATPQPEVLVPMQTGRGGKYVASMSDTDSFPQRQLQDRLRALFDPMTIVTANPLQNGIERWLQNPKMHAVLFGTFAAVALLLVCAGLAAVCVFEMERRSKEVSIRLALGSGSANLRIFLLRSALRPVAIGVLLGSISAYWLASVVQNTLPLINLRSPWAFLIVTLAIFISSGAAAAVPIWRVMARSSPRTLAR